MIDRKRPPLRALPLLALTCVLPTLASAQDDPVVHWYDVRALEAAGLEEQIGVDLRLHLQSSYLDALEPESYDVALEEDAEFGIDEVTQLVLDGLGEDWPDGRVYADARAGRLRVEGSAETHAEVRRILDELTSHALETLDLEIAVLDSVPRDARAVLTAAAAEQLISQLPPEAIQRTSIRANRREIVGAQSLSAVLMDYDVEVASKARTPDPQVTALREGLRLGLLAQPRDDGSIFLRTWGRNGKRRALRNVTLSHFDDVPLELPTHSTGICVASGVVPSGGALLVGGQPGAGGAWLVRVTRRDAATATRAFVPLAELTARPIVVSPPWLPRTSPSGGWGLPDNDLLEQLGDAAFDVVYTPDDVLELLWDARDQDALGGSLQLVGSNLYVRGSDKLGAAARELVARLTREIGIETIEVDVRFGLLPGDHALLGADVQELAEQLPQRLLGSCRLGDSLLVLSGNEAWYLQDHDVEIAEGSAIPDPTIGNLFEGLSLWCVPNRPAPGRLALWTDMSAQAVTEELRTTRVATWEPRTPELHDNTPLPTGTFHGTALVELPTLARAENKTMLSVRDDEWALLGRTRLAGSDLVLVAVVRAGSVR